MWRTAGQADKMFHVNASIVLYHNKRDQVLKAVNSFLDTELKVKLYLLDNSQKNDLKDLESIDKRIEYIFNNANLGYGKAHNIAIRKSIKDGAEYHLVLNPDVYFEEGVLERLYDYAAANPDVGMVMPTILYPDGSIQYLCKLLPTPFDLFGRRFLNSYPMRGFIDKRTEAYELRSTRYNKIMNIPCLSGCFMFLRTKALEEIGLFDEIFFMYLEDTDLSRRIHCKYKTIYYPYVSIYHEYERGSYKSKKLLIYHIHNTAKYFNKWGWIFDDERDRINRDAIEKLRDNG